MENGLGTWLVKLCILCEQLHACKMQFDPAYNVFNIIGLIIKQVIMSEDAWRNLLGDMPAGGFPTVFQLGLFKINAMGEPNWIYQVRNVATC